MVSERRFDWEQWLEKKERHQVLRMLTLQTLAIGKCRSKITCMGRNYTFLFWGKKLESMEEEEWSVLDRQVQGVIRLTLTRSNAHDVVKEKIIADLMKALFSMYEKPSANNKVHLMKKLFNLKMVEGTPVAQHLNEFNIITNQLSSVEIDFDDEICALIVLTVFLQSS